MKKKNDKIIEWFIEEGILKQEDNFYIAEKAFQAHSFINWIKKEFQDGNLTENEIEQMMLLIRMFLQNEVNLEWKNGIINVINPPSKKDENHADEKTNDHKDKG